MHVMIVDDNAKMRRMMMSMLLDTADTFVECADGSEVLAAYRAHHPDWIVMDIVMEKLDGIAATKALTRRYPEAKIIIVTQHNDADLQEKALRAGAVGFVLKENLSDLQKIIRGRSN